MYYVYRFLDKAKNIIYVSKSKQDLEIRFKGHLHLPKECYNMVYKIEYIQCSTESDMSIKEIYYINKFRNDINYFNILDTSELPRSVEFNDKWKMYRGSLPEHFSHSLNYLKGYPSSKDSKNNATEVNGDLRIQNKQKGISSFVEGFTSKEVNQIVDHFIEKINTVEDDHHKQLCFRNLMMFVVGINLPIRPSEFIALKYKDLFDENNLPKDYFLLTICGISQKQTISIPIRKNVKELFTIYSQQNGFDYITDADTGLFQSRKHQIITSIAWGNILKTSAKEIGIKKNICAESLRKTYGLNIYKHSQNKLQALLFLGELWGQIREAKVIQYLGLADTEINYDYYFGEKFTLGTVDLSKITF